jgi:hypothetical protein
MNREANNRHIWRFYINLTPRQREVVELVSRGLTNQEIADELCIAPSVVAGHLTNIYGELADARWGSGGLRSKRYALIRLFSGFFERYEVQAGSGVGGEGDR